MAAMINWPIWHLPALSSLLNTVDDKLLRVCPHIPEPDMGEGLCQSAKWDPMRNESMRFSDCCEGSFLRRVNQPVQYNWRLLSFMYQLSLHDLKSISLLFSCFSLA